MKKLNIARYRHIPFTKREFCEICEKKLSDPVFEFPKFPMTEIYTTQKVKQKVAYCDQFFHICKHCGHGQLTHVIDVKLQYGDAISYSFRASESATGRDSAEFFIRFLKKFINIKQYKLIVDIGCNDMYILHRLKNRAVTLIGIDPILKDKEKQYSQENLIAIGDFFESVKLNECADVVICKDTLEHVENPKQFVKKVVSLGNEHTLYFFQFPLFETLLENCRFDQIFHQHLNYFTLASIHFLLNELGFELLDHTINYNLWGSVLVVFRKNKHKQKNIRRLKPIALKMIQSRYQIFKNSMTNTQQQLELIKNELLYGYGAALMLPVLSYHLGNDFSTFKYILDEDIRKDGLYYINLPVEIKQVSKIADIRDATLLVTAISTITNTRRILAKLARINPKKILVPLNAF